MSITKKSKDGQPMTIKPLKNYFVVVMDSGNTCIWSIAWRKKDAIIAYLHGRGGSDIENAWEDAKKRGHRVVKVNITFEPA